MLFPIRTLDRSLDGVTYTLTYAAVAFGDLAHVSLVQGLTLDGDRDLAAVTASSGHHSAFDFDLGKWPLMEWRIIRLVRRVNQAACRWSALAKKSFAPDLRGLLHCPAVKVLYGVCLVRRSITGS